MANLVLGEMTWTELRDFLKNVQLAIVPVGSTEQHAPHMADNADITVASYLAKKVAEKLYPKAIVAPDIPIGVSWHHMKYAGTLTLRESTMIEYCYDVAKSLKNHGIKFVVFLNGHYGNKSVLAIACNKIRLELGIKAITVSYDLFMPHETAAKTIEEGAIYSHAGEAETSIMMVVNPNYVRKDKLKRTETFTMDPKKFHLFLQADDQFPIYDVASKDGLDYASAEKASPEKGKKMLDSITNEITNFISDLLKSY